jgi:hypothetical protein
VEAGWCVWVDFAGQDELLPLADALSPGYRPRVLSMLLLLLLLLFLLLLQLILLLAAITGAAGVPRGTTSCSVACSVWLCRFAVLFKFGLVVCDICSCWGGVSPRGSPGRSMQALLRRVHDLSGWKRCCHHRPEVDETASLLGCRCSCSLTSRQQPVFRRMHV